MEKNTSIILPEEFKQPKKRGRKPLEKPVEVIRPRLARTNREVECIFCEQKRILNPDQYQAYFDYWGDEEKINKNFICKPCEVSQQENPHKFWYIHSKLMKRLVKNLKATFEAFRVSHKTHEDELSLTRMIIAFLGEANIKVEPNLRENKHLDFIIVNNLVEGILIKNIPFVGTIQIMPYIDEKIKIYQ